MERLTFASEKVKALAEDTLAQCRQQGFTLQEVAMLIFELQEELQARRNELEQASF